MNFRATLMGLIVGLAASPAAWAEDGIGNAAGVSVEPPVLLRGVIREEDVSMLFDYLRLALASAMAGKEAAPPAELERRAEALANELRRRGALAGLLVLSVLEQQAKEALRETPPQAPPGLPPLSPFAPARSAR